MSYRSPLGVRLVCLAVAAVVAIVLALGITGSAFAQSVAYDSLPNPIPPNIASLGYAATSTSEFGDRIEFANGASGALQSVTVLMSSWACQAGDWTTGCTTTPGATYPHEITLNLYGIATDDLGLAPFPGSLIATQSVEFAIPYRPSSSPACADTVTWPTSDPAHAAYRWLDVTTDTCNSGLAFPITFDFVGDGVTLPKMVVYGISFNTANDGPGPLGVAGPYDALNVGAETNDSLVGTDVDPEGVFWDTSHAPFYCDGGALGAGEFRLDDASDGCTWADSRPTARFVMDAPVVRVPDQYVNLRGGVTGFVSSVLLEGHGLPVSAAQFSLGFDSECLAVSPSPGAALPAGSDFQVTTPGPGQIDFAITAPAIDANTAAAIPDGPLVQLQVTIAETCRDNRIVDLTFPLGATCGNSAGSDLSCVTDDGAITLDLNDAPTDVSLSPSDFSGTQPAGGLLGLFTLVDDDPSPPVVCEFVGEAPPATLLLISGNELHVGTEPLPWGFYTFFARCMDNGGLFSPTREFMVRVFGTATLDIPGENQTWAVPSPQEVSYPYLVREGNTLNDVEVSYDHHGNPATLLVFSVSESSPCLNRFSIQKTEPGARASLDGNIVRVEATGTSLPMGPLVTLRYRTDSCPGMRNDIPLDLEVLEYKMGDVDLNITSDDGMIVAIENSARGDCNGSGEVSSGDYVATVLEIFGTDPTLDPHNFWLDATRFGHVGSPFGCDSNQSAYVETPDIVCTVRLSFGMTCTPVGTLTPGVWPASSTPAELSVASGASGVSLALAAHGHTPAALAFRIVLPEGMAFDGADADGDGNADAVHFAQGGNLLRMAQYDAANRTLNLAVAGISLPLPTIDGAIATLDLPGLDGIQLTDVSVASDEGVELPVITRVGEESNLYYRMFLPNLKR